jgi:pimeloyl-ACP methyl ester carboxylesterase
MLFERDGTRLSYQDFGGSGPPMLLLHGLAGYAGEWRPSAELLVADYRVFALDQRGHGDSERRPGDVSRVAYVEDCAEMIRRLGRGPVTLAGQSMGANTAMLTTARHPDLVTRLVVIEGSPDGPEPPDPDPAIAAEIRDSLSRWPVPFADEHAARRFFCSKGSDPAAWTAGLERRADGLWPRFDIDTMVECMSDLGSRSYWPQWRIIRCPTLVVCGERGIFPVGHGEQIVSQLPGSKLRTVAGAGHDVHLDAPEAWVRALTGLERPRRNERRLVN